MDQIYTQMKDDTESITLTGRCGVSKIRQFYAGKTIFITGCTGYLGKCIVEKLLRGCPEIKKIFMLIRAKKSVSPEERLEKYFDNSIFNPLRVKYPDFKKKVKPIVGDFLLDNIGLSSEDRSLIVNETDIIIHNAACVIFDKEIKSSIQINVLGTKEMLDLACECRDLKLFLYVSTAYSHCYQQHIEEKFYRPPADLKMINDMLKADQENARGLMSDALKVALGDWPNIYVFTKATAEGLVQEYSRKHDFACCIYRPAIITSTYKEPLAQWCGNMHGPQLPYIGVGTGALHVIYTDEIPIDFVPADMAVNSLLACMWDTVENAEPQRDVHIYNCGTSNINPVTLRDTRNYMVESGLRYPPSNAVWYYFTILTKCKYNFYLLHFLFHVIPALFADIFFLIQGKKPKFLPVIFMIHKHLEKLFYFCNGNWRIHVEKMALVWDKMNDADKDEFYCDLRTVCWEDYLKNYWRGIRVFLLKDPMDNVEAARKRYAKLKMAHYSLVTLFGLGLLYFIYRIVCNVLGF